MSQRREIFAVDSRLVKTTNVPNQRAEKGRSMRKMNSLHLSIVFCDASRSPRYAARAASPFERARTACFHLRLRGGDGGGAAAVHVRGGRGRGGKREKKKTKGAEIEFGWPTLLGSKPTAKTPHFLSFSPRCQQPFPSASRPPSRPKSPTQPPLLLRPSPDEVFELAPERPKLDLI